MHVLSCVLCCAQVEVKGPQRLNPRVHIPAEVTAIHHITQVHGEGGGGPLGRKGNMYNTWTCPLQQFVKAVKQSHKLLCLCTHNVCVGG